MDLEAVAAKAVEMATAAGAGDAEAYCVEETGRTVRVHGGEVESLTAATERGIGVRAWREGRVGYAYGTDLSDGGLRAVAESAAGAAEVADADEFAAPPQPGGEPEVLGGLRDDSIAATPTEDVIALAIAVERVALDADKRILGVEQAVYADADELVAIASSSGIGAAYEASSAYAYLQAMADGGESRETGLGFGMGRGPAALDAAAIGAEAAERALGMIGAAKPESRSCPVVLDPTVAASFIGFIGGTLGADSVQRGRSPFAERLGEEVASEALVLTDDGLDPDGLASSPVDGEGVARRRLELITGGRLKTFLHDTYTANRGKTESTASAGRAGYRSGPSVSASNLVIAPGDASLAALLAQAEGGIYINDVAGLHSGVNPVAGTFSVGASGRTITNGELAAPVREFTIASDLVAMLRSVAAAGSEARWVPFGGSVSTPPLLVSEMAIGGS